MGQKVKPIGLRVGINRTWDSRWYAGRNYGQLLHEDIKLRAYLMDRLKQAAISRVVIERPAGRARVTIHAGRPGLIIGKKGQDIEKFRLDLSTRIDGEVSLNIVEVRKPEIDANLLFPAGHKMQMKFSWMEITNQDIRQIILAAYLVAYLPGKTLL